MSLNPLCDEDAEPDLLCDNVLCPCCLAPNRPIDEFCVNCGMPIGQYVATDPFKSIETRWRYVGRASEGYVSRWMLWGFWLLLGPHVLFAGIAILLMVFWGGWELLSDWAMNSGSYDNNPFNRVSGFRWTVVGTVRVLAIVLTTTVVFAEYVVYGILLYRVTRRYRDQHGLAPTPD